LRQSGAPAALAREDGHIVGIFTLSDIARVASDDPDGLDAMRVGQVISRQIVSAYPDETLYAAWLRMTRRGMRQIVVVERGKSSKRVGLLSLDQVRQVLRLQRLVPRAPTAASAAAGPGASDTAPVFARAAEPSPAASLARGVVPASAAPAPAGDPFAALRVEDAMQPTPTTFAESTPVDELRATVYRDGCALVVDAAGKLTGIIVGRDLRERGATDGGKPSLARDIATRNLVTARRRERLPVAVRRMVRAGVRQLPVVDADAAGTPVGLLRRTDALVAFDRVESLEEGLTAGAGQPPTTPAPSSQPTTRQG